MFSDAQSYGKQTKWVNITKNENFVEEQGSFSGKLWKMWEKIVNNVYVDIRLTTQVDVQTQSIDCPPFLAYVVIEFPQVSLEPLKQTWIVEKEDFEHLLPHFKGFHNKHTS